MPATVSLPYICAPLMFRGHIAQERQIIAGRVIKPEGALSPLLEKEDLLSSRRPTSIKAKRWSTRRIVILAHHPIDGKILPAIGRQAMSVPLARSGIRAPTSNRKRLLTEVNPRFEPLPDRELAAFPLDGRCLRRLAKG